ncbi:MAG: hypothetical protein WA431_09655 [Candidatus Cybelea sp.]
MATSTAVHPSVRAAFDALIDYAGLFPPAQLTPAAAEREYLAARAGPHAWMLGRFIVPAAGLTEPSTLAGPFSVIVEPHLEALSEVAGLRELGLTIEALEIPLGTSHPEVVTLLEGALSVARLRDIPAFAEISRAQAWHESLAMMMPALARAGVGVKIRCGGLTASAFPSVEEVAAFIAAAQAHGVPFKATAGLHHPVRQVDPNTGFPMHGFLNLLAAAALAPSLEPEVLATIVAEEDPSAFQFDDASFAWRDRRIDVARLEQTRRSGFVAYGSCSFAEPVDDLIALGILPSA